MRFALGVDEDPAPVPAAFRPRPADRPLARAGGRGCACGRRPDPFEALVLAICEQLIEYERAAAIERRVVAALGRRWVGWDGGHSTLADMPLPERLAGTPPALLESFDLAGCRADHARQGGARGGARPRRPARRASRARLARLRAIPGIGPWTVEMMALHGQGRHDQLPAGDLGLLRFAGRVLSRRGSAGVRGGTAGARAVRALRRVGRAGGRPRDRALSAPQRESRSRTRAEAAAREALADPAAAAHAHLAAALSGGSLAVCADAAQRAAAGVARDRIGGSARAR